ncbi:MAG: hypothetical protein ACREK1_11730 [Longimicrobiales bacterium]
MIDVPAKARTASVLLLIYAGLVLASAVHWQMQGPDAVPRDLFRAAVRVAGIVLIALGLFRGARWAWWAGVVFAGFWLLMGAVGVMALVIAASRGTATGISMPSALFMLAALAVLGTGWTLLLTQQVRQAYRGD